MRGLLVGFKVKSDALMVVAWWLRWSSTVRVVGGVRRKEKDEDWEEEGTGFRIDILIGIVVSPHLPSLVKMIATGGERFRILREGLRRRA